MVNFHHVAPILSVKSLPAAVDYYVDKLGFDHRWSWGDPATFGCVARGEIEIFLCQGDQGQPGTWLSIFIDDVDTLHQQYQASGAIIREAPADRPWGTREMHVEDLDGHRLRMTGQPAYKRPATATDELPEHIAIELRKATADEYRTLLEAVGWDKNQTTIDKAIEHALFFVIAVDQRDGKVAGMLRVCGDGRQYTIWDVMVLPTHQGQKIGTALVEQAMARLRQIGPKGAFVGLFTGNPAFYERLGFKGNSGAMQTAL